MKPHLHSRSERLLTILSLLLLPTALPCMGQSAISGSAGVNMGNSANGYIYNARPVDFATDFPSSTAWTSGDPARAVLPVSNFTGIMANGSNIAYSNLLPLRPKTLTVTNSSNEIITIMDDQGIDTLSVNASTINLVDPATLQVYPLATVSGGAVNFSQSAFKLPGDTVLSTPFPGAVMMGSPSYGVQASNYRAVALGGGNNNASGDSSVIIGGSNGTASGAGAVVIGGGGTQANLASGAKAVIIGSEGSTAAALYSTIIGSPGSDIMGTYSVYSAIVGGNGHQMVAAGGYNVIMGGGSNEISGTGTSNGACSAIIAGSLNKIFNGSYNEAVIAGKGNVLRASVESVIVGGLNNEIQDAHNVYAQNVILGGINGKVLANSRFSSLVGGEGNQVSGQNCSVIGAAYSSAAGLDSVVIGGALNHTNAAFSVATGLGSKAEGAHQFVLGRYNTIQTQQALIIGNGASDTVRSNAMTVDFDGNVEAAGEVRARSIHLTNGADTSDISMGEYSN